MTFKAVVDRIEGEQAVLLVGEAETEVIFPVKFLPQNCEEGDHLKGAWSIDHEATEQAKERIRSLIEKLVNRSDDQD